MRRVHNACANAADVSLNVWQVSIALSKVKENNKFINVSKNNYQVCSSLGKYNDNNDKMYEVQGGFTKGKSTIDQIFVFQSLVSKYLPKKRGRFYTYLLILLKFFDSVPHLHLFYSLIQEGLHGRTICLLQDMYQKLNSCIQTSSGCITESFPCVAREQDRDVCSVRWCLFSI